jgi:hypothetical protein
MSLAGIITISIPSFGVYCTTSGDSRGVHSDMADFVKSGQVLLLPFLGSSGTLETGWGDVTQIQVSQALSAGEGLAQNLSP